MTGKKTTIDRQSRRVAGGSGGVRGRARELAHVFRIDRLDGEQADARIGVADGNALLVARRQIPALKRPGDVDGQVPLDDRTDRRHDLAPVRRFLAEREWQNLG